MQVLYEDNHLYVVNKPAELATMGALSGIPTALGVAKADIARKYQKPGAVYLGVVSRLDAAVTGVLIFARTSKAAARLSAQFRDRSTQKTYLAMTSHAPPENSSTIRCWLKRDDRRKLTVAASQEDSDAQFCSLRYLTIAQQGGIHLLQISLETGRKHQIRAQFAELNMPILGDRRYGSTSSFPAGIALHAVSLRIRHPVLPAECHFVADLPAYWPRWVIPIVQSEFQPVLPRRSGSPD
jgi:23S rRNA pseudouridine1911/1915/1917 synthase